MNLDQLIDLTKRTFPGYGIIIRHDPTDKSKRWFVNLFDAEVHMREWLVGQHKFPVYADDPLRALEAAYSWLSLWVIKGEHLYEPPKVPIELIKKDNN